MECTHRCDFYSFCSTLAIILHGRPNTIKGCGPGDPTPRLCPLLSRHFQIDISLSQRILIEWLNEQYIVLALTICTFRDYTEIFYLLLIKILINNKLLSGLILPVQIICRFPMISRKLLIENKNCLIKKLILVVNYCFILVSLKKSGRK